MWWLSSCPSWTRTRSSGARGRRAANYANGQYERPSIHADTWQAPPAELEPAILRLTAACSTTLSYGGIMVTKNQVGMTGFEPATFCSQSRRATKLRYIPLKGDDGSHHRGRGRIRTCVDVKSGGLRPPAIDHYATRPYADDPLGSSPQRHRESNPNTGLEGTAD